MSINYDINEKYNCVVIRLTGKVMGGPDAKTFRKDLDELIEEGKKNVIIDLSKVKFMNSSGLGILVGGLKKIKEAGGDLKICGATEKINSLLMVSQLNKIFDVFDTLDEAIAAYK